MELLRCLLAIFVQVSFLPYVSALPRFLGRRDDEPIAPKVMIISMVCASVMVKVNSDMVLVVS